MKIAKSEIVMYVERAKKWRDHLCGCLASDLFNYDFAHDEVYNANWSLYFTDMHERYGQEVGDILFSLIEYTQKHWLPIENIIGALLAIGIEV